MKRKEKLELNLILAFVVLYVAFFLISAVLKGNYEFLYYGVIVSILIIIAKVNYENFHLSSSILFGLAILGFFHLMGGNTYPGGVRLYDHYFWIFRYDNFVHFLGGFMMLLVSYSLLAPHFKSIKHERPFAFSMILILFTLGAGAVVEMTELLSVIFLNAGPRVGDYFNNAFDIVFNFLGASCASIVAYFYRKRHLNN
ncbi:hypothetical protein KY311_01600 [Candidatus Woesearchaeota archaeon]|nr:hypothetical protein [Candidatus Woesearchaeota archaeon]